MTAPFCRLGIEYVEGWTAQNNAAFPAPPDNGGWLDTFPVDQVYLQLCQYYYDGDSNGLGGFLTFWPSDSFTITENDVTWRVPQRLLGTLTWPYDNAGVSPWAFSMEGSGKIFIWNGWLTVRLAATDNPNLVTDSGDPLTYHVTEHFKGGREFDITVPGALATATNPTLYAQIVSGSAVPYQYDPIDPMGYLGANLDIPPGYTAPSGGGGGDSGATNFSQAFTDESTVTVNHNLGYNPAVTIVDSDNDMVVGDVEFIDINNLTVSFSAPFSGFVYCN